MHIFLSKEDIKVSVDKGEHFLVAKPNGNKTLHPVKPIRESDLQDSQLITLYITTSLTKTASTSCIEPNILILVDKDSGEISKCISILPEQLTVIIYNRYEIENSIIVQTKTHNKSAELDNDDLLMKACDQNNAPYNQSGSSAWLSTSLCRFQLKALRYATPRSCL